MNKITRTVSFMLACTMLLASCSSTTMIQSNPSQAKVYLDGELVGVTPYQHTDTKIVGSSMSVKIEKEGFNPFITTINKDEEADVGAIVGGLFFVVPFLWTLKYKPVHNYELVPSGFDTPVSNEMQQNTISLSSKATKLRELKKLVDDKIITQEEFEKEKTKVLNEKE